MRGRSYGGIRGGYRKTIDLAALYGRVPVDIQTGYKNGRTVMGQFQIYIRTE